MQFQVLYLQTPKYKWHCLGIYFVSTEFFNILFWIKLDIFPPIPVLEEVNSVSRRVKKTLEEYNTKVYH